MHLAFFGEKLGTCTMWAFKLACVYFIALLHGCTAFATALSLDGPAEIVTAADHVEPDTALRHGGAVEREQAVR